MTIAQAPRPHLHAVRSARDEAGAWPRAARARGEVRRLARVGIAAVAAVSAIVAVCTALIVFATGVLLWQAGAGTGFVERIEELGATLTTDGEFNLDGGALLAAWAGLAALWAIAVTVVGTLLGVIVNAACRLTGGIPVVLQERPRR